MCWRNFCNFPRWLKDVKSRSKIALFSNERHLEIWFPKKRTITFYIVLLSIGYSPGRPTEVMESTWGQSSRSFPRFSRASQCNTGRCSRPSALRGRGAYLRSSRFQANPPLTEKRQLFPGLRPASPGSIASQLWPPTGGGLRLQAREYWPDSLSTEEGGAQTCRLSSVKYGSWGRVVLTNFEGA